MTICITSTGSTLDSLIDHRFGRCEYFLILDENGKLLKSILNKGIEATRGAGVTAAQIIADEKVDVIITGNIGPNAYGILGSLDIKIFSGVLDITVQQAFEKFKKGELKEIDPSDARGFGPGFGRGLNR